MARHISKIYGGYSIRMRMRKLLKSKIWYDKPGRNLFIVKILKLNTCHSVYLIENKDDIEFGSFLNILSIIDIFSVNCTENRGHRTTKSFLAKFWKNLQQIVN